jgi:hypothetical protein
MKKVIVLASVICISIFCASAQTASKYWTISTTPFSGLNPDPYFGLSVGRTNADAKRTLLLNLGYAYRGILFNSIGQQFQNYKVGGTVSSLEYQIGIEEYFYVGANAGLKYIASSAGQWQTNGSGTSQQLVMIEQKKTKGNFSFIVGAKNKITKVGFCYDVNIGLGLSGKQYRLNGDVVEDSYFADGSSTMGGILPYGHLTMRVGYRIPPKN